LKKKEKKKRKEKKREETHGAPFLLKKVERG